MDVSFILSGDELFSLMSLFPSHSDAGKKFLEDVLADAKPNDLSCLVEKKLARYNSDGNLELFPVIRMIADAMAHADSIENAWVIHSQWITLHCEIYPFKDKHYKITPMKGAEYENIN